MAKQTINIGTSPNSGNGDPLRTAMDIINDNFNELYISDSINSSKITNATHDGDVSGNTTLTLATVNANVGSFTNANLTVNSKGLITAVSNGTGGIGGDMIYPGVGIALSTGTTWSTSITNNSSNWNTAYGWGNHASMGYLTSQISHANVVVDGDFVSNGILRRISSGVYNVLTDNSSSWDTAYGWGNHATVGYLTSQISHSDVVIDGDFASNGILKRTSSGVYGIVTDNSAYWDTAYGWGDHSVVGYALVNNQTFTGTVTIPSLKIPTDAVNGYFWKCTNVDGSGAWTSVTASSVYNGAWNASTNTPSLSDGVGTSGDYYHVVTGGTIDLGSGNITFIPGDDIWYDGSIWEKISGSGYILQTATSNVLGGVKIGSGVTITNGIISVSTSYAAINHNLIDPTHHLVSGLTTGHFLKATGATTYAFAAHGLTYTDVGAAATGQTFYLGTTSIAINRASGSLGLTGIISIDGSSISVKSPSTTGLITFTGMAAGQTRAKTVRDAADTILELDGSYTPTGTWNWGSATVTWPTFNQSTSGNAGTITVTDTTSSTCYLGLYEATTGSLAGKTDTGLIYNASTGLLTCTNGMFSANFTLSSDNRLKTNINTMPVEFIDIQYKTFEYKNNIGYIRYGIIAQDLQLTNPELIYTNEDGTLGINIIDLLLRKVAYLEQQLLKR
jgi:hypothetical protein